MSRPRISSSSSRPPTRSTRQQKFEDAVGIYRTILSGAPSLAVVNLQIAAAYRNMKQYDKAIAAYNDLLKAEPENQQAVVGMAMTDVAKGDVQAAEQALTRAAEAPLPSRDVFYDLAEIKVAKNQTEEAARLYQRAADTDLVMGEAAFQAWHDRDDQGRQSGGDEGHVAGDCGRSDLAGSCASEDCSRTAQVGTGG